MHHGRYFQKLLKEYDPDRQKLADAIGVHRNSLYNLIDDETISWERWYAIANFLKVDVWKDIPDMPVPKRVLREDPEFYGTLSLAESLREISKLNGQVSFLQEELRKVQKENSQLHKQIIEMLGKKKRA